MKIWFVDTLKIWNVFLDFCHDIISYLVTSETVIQPGETIGRTEEEQIAVSHGESAFGRGTVMKLEF